MLLLLFAPGCQEDAPTDTVCSFGEELPTCEVVDACTEGVGGDRADCREELAGSWGCDPDWVEGAGDTTQDGLVYVGDLSTAPYSHAASFTITDAATWAELTATIPGSSDWAPIDFDTELVVIAQLAVNSTCGMGLVRHGVWMTPANESYPVKVYAEWEDSSGSCGSVCDMSMRSGVIYAVPRSRGWPEVCSSVINRCE